MISDFLALPKTPIKYNDMLFFLTISPDNTKLITASTNVAKVWNIHNKLICSLVGHTGYIQVIAITPDNAYVITGGTDNTAKIWDIYTGQLKQTCVGHTNIINSITISHDSRYLKTGSYDTTVKTWDIGTGQLLQTKEGFKYSSKSLAKYYSNRVTPMSKYTESTTKLINMGTTQTQHIITQHPSTICSAAISQDNAYIALGLTDRTLKIIPLQLNLEEQESKTFSWIKNNILPYQAHLIIRTCAATQVKNVFIIHSGSDDAMVWITFPDYVRYYLRSRLNIQLKK